MQSFISKFKSEKLWNYQPCQNCGSFVVQEDNFCRRCFNYFSQRAEQECVLQKINGFDCLSLFSSTPLIEKDSLQGVMIRNKDQSNVYRYNDFFKMYFNNEVFVRSLDRFKKPFLVVPPTQRDQNHALAMAQNLGRKLQTKAFSPFESPQSASQKSLAKKERHQKQLELLEDFTWLRGREIIAIDDMTTTGSTLNAIYENLGRPSCFLAVTIAHRRRLATKSIF